MSAITGRLYAWLCTAAFGLGLALSPVLLTGCAAVRDLEVRADASSQLAGAVHYGYGGHDFGGGHVGRVEVIAPLYREGGFTLFGSVSHESLLDTSHDRGEERVRVGFSWRPFAP